MTRSRIGPLAMEAPLGGKGTHVFRALHVEQRVQVAVRVYSIPMGMTPEGKKEFAQEMELLKKLKHPNIARCYGGGFDQRDCYLVYELVDGESLESLLSRRERLPWEVVLDYGTQLCSALQYAHENKWHHGRIRPDKLVITKDNTQIKIVDFRGESTGGMGAASPQVKHLAYTAPEALDGDRSIAADLYSLGAVLYQMLTGTVPFQEKDLSALKRAIVANSVPPVATVVYDCPVWLSSIVEQLMEKSPEKRLYSAGATGLALSEAQRRASMGTSVVQHAVSGFSPLQVKSADRKEAEKILGHKKKKIRNRSDDESASAFYERPWFLVLGLFCIIGAIYWFTLPLSAQTLRKKAEALLATGELNDGNDARELYLDRILEKYPNSQTAVWAQEQIEEIEMKNAERKMERNIRRQRPPSSQVERLYVEANRFERFGDRVTALTQYESIVNLHRDVEEDRPFVLLAQRQIEKIKAEPPGSDELRLFLEKKLDEASRLRDAGDDRSARTIWESIVSLYAGNEEMKSIVQKSKSGIKSLDKEPETDEAKK